MSEPAPDPVYRTQAARLIAAHPRINAEVDDLVGILQASTVRIVPKGQVVVREEDPGTELFFLLRGSIAILKRDVSGKQRPVGELRAPTLLGQIGVVDRSRRTATGVAASEVIVAVLDQGSFQRLIRETHPRGRALRRLLLSSLTQQLVTANERLRDLLAARADPAAAGRAGLGEAFLRASGVLEGSTEDALPTVDPPFAG